MSFIKIDESSKGGPCCSKSIDFEIGCRNKCVGCYGSKTSYMSEKYFNEIKAKDYDEKKFRNACKLSFTKGVRFVRVGKHSDPGFSGNTEVLRSVLKIAGEEGLRLVVVSKSLTYDKEIANLMDKYNHILHISLGMLTEAPSDRDRYMTYQDFFNNSAVNVNLRIVGDITKEFPYRIYQSMNSRCIITPMRFISKEVAVEYGADLSKYKYINGYYRLITDEIHESWKQFSHWCGESVNSDGTTNAMCCKCLVK
ncbi:MAG TPA: hypothetical protein VF941_06330 [Clostridia bacterium]